MSSAFWEGVLRSPIRKSVLNCVQCSQTCAEGIVTVVVLVTDIFFSILGVEAQQNGARAAGHSHRNVHLAS